MFLYAKTGHEKTLYLTFDDGPVVGVTEPLLDLLKKFDVSSTFFVIGANAEKNPSLMSRIHNEGHAIANHSYSHPNFNKITTQAQQEEVKKTNNIIYQTTQQPCHLFRAPQGRWNIKLLYVLWKEKITAIHWSRDSLDFKKAPPETLIQRFKQQAVNSGDIILFHDDNALCITVLNELIPYWQSQGYTMKKLAGKN